MGRFRNSDYINFSMNAWFSDSQSDSMSMTP